MQQDHMKAAQAEYLHSLRSLDRPEYPRVPFFSSVTGRTLEVHEQLDAQYFTRNLISPVLFSTAVNSILEAMPQSKLFLEIGPHSALAGPIRQIFRHKGVNDEYVSVLERSKNSRSGFLKAIGELWLYNLVPNLEKVVEKGQFLTDLPLYPWHYEEPLWVESRLSREWRFREFPHHDLLGLRVSESTDVNPSWRNILRLDTVTWIKEHVISGQIILPAVSYVCMAGEAIRQLSGTVDYTVQDLDIKTACVLHQGQDVEVLTQLQRLPIMNAVDSVWYTFSVFTMHENVWTTHATGRVRPGTENPRVFIEEEDCVRELSSRKWYQKLRSIGYDYGPRFLGLKNLKAHPTKTISVAKVANDNRPGESQYNIHPTTFDLMLQLMFQAHSNGLPRNLKNSQIPVFIKEVYVSPLASEMDLRATQYPDVKIIVKGDIVGTVNGEVVVEMLGVECAVLGDLDDTTGKDLHAGVELEWKADLNLVDSSALIKPIQFWSDMHDIGEKFGAACMLEARDRLEGFVPEQEFFKYYLEWLRTITQADYEGSQGVNFAPLRGMSREDRRQLILELYGVLKETDLEPMATAVHRVLESCEDIITGVIDNFDALLYNNVLTRLYDATQTANYAAFMDLLSHMKPNLKILEVGAGIGGTTGLVLPWLKSAYGERMYFSYTYTDISSGFFVSAKDRFKDYPGLEYTVLDISEDPAAQGFEAGSFDLIIAANVG